ncbi:hypothetical protein HY637_03305 [Candidatus Woesearchaeota archaeon]|nr:hypothetical protein [Candidatus Woesearchaeota archaeon]
MVNEVTLSLYFICHHESRDEVIRDAELVRRVACEKWMPVTFFFSGVELEAILRERETIKWALDGFDLVAAIQGDFFINPRFGMADPYRPELGIMTFNHVPLAQPFLEDQGEYLKGVLPDQIGRSINIAQYGFHKTPVTLHASDGVYALYSAHDVRQQGVDTVVASGEFLDGNERAKGNLYWASGLRHLIRNNGIQLQDRKFYDARHFVDVARYKASLTNGGRVVSGCDSNEVNGMSESANGMSLRDGITRVCCIGDEAYRSGVRLINCNASAHLPNRNGDHADLESIWPWNDVHAMQNAEGNLSWIIRDRNDIISYAVWLVGERHRQRWDVREAKEHLYLAADSALRHEHYGHFFTEHFKYHINQAIGLLQGDKYYN